MSSHVEAAGSCQQKGNVVLGWVTPGLHCCKMPFRSPGAGSKSGAAGKESHLSIPADHKQPRGREGLVLVLLPPSRGPCVLSLCIKCSELNPEPRRCRKSGLLQSKSFVLNVKMHLKFFLQRTESPCEFGQGFSANLQNSLAVPI